MTEQHLEVIPGVEELSAPRIEVGQWYWIEREPDDNIPGPNDCIEGNARFACVVQIGTNFVEFESPNYRTRVHADEVETMCRYEPNSQDIINREVAVSQAKVQELMREVQAITARLGVQEALSEGGETRALALLGDANYKGYQTALEKAKNKDLPALFEDIENANKRLTSWLTAIAIPLKADYELQRGIIEKVEAKIFHVQIYAGLVEDIVTVKDGEPAPHDEKLRIYQRKFYMDEECLLDYKAGGMEFKDLPAFDRWLKKKKNLERILPFQRCIVSFQIRRNAKDRGTPEDLGQFIYFKELEKLDKGTLLYIRNGKQLHRLHTEIEFGETLFPDLDRTKFEGKLWVHGDYHHSYRNRHGGEGVIDQNKYDGLGEDYIAAKKKHRKAVTAYRKAQKTVKKDDKYYKDLKLNWITKAAGERRSLADLLQRNGFHEPRSKPQDERKHYIPFDQTNLYYDEAIQKLAKQAAEFNRIALVLQGLFDRSAILHPHPKVKLWTPEGMDAAVELLFDADRALHQAEKPDFEKYRAKLNASIGVGSVTIGQYAVWWNIEADKEYERQVNNWRCSKPYRPGGFWWTPYGNDGPGRLDVVVRFQRKVRRCVFEWQRERLTHDKWKVQSDKILTKIAVDVTKLLNVSAYKPGDYLQFFQDPRTRAEYMKWAPLLLAAEDYHAGKAKVGT